MYEPPFNNNAKTVGFITVVVIICVLGLGSFMGEIAQHVLVVIK